MNLVGDSPITKTLVCRPEFPGGDSSLRYCFVEKECNKMRKVLSIKQQAELFDNVLQQRLDDLLPTLMKRQGISMWIVMNREYNEDPVYLSLGTGHGTVRPAAVLPDLLSQRSGKDGALQPGQ